MRAPFRCCRVLQVRFSGYDPNDLSTLVVDVVCITCGKAANPIDHAALWTMVAVSPIKDDIEQEDIEPGRDASERAAGGPAPIIEA